MKPIVSIRSLLLSFGLLASGALFADVVPATEARLRYSALPEPAGTVKLSNIPQRFQDATVKIALTVAADGSVHDIAAVTRFAEDLRSVLFAQVAEWRFTPARNQDGQPVALRVIYPLTFRAKAAAPAKPVKQPEMS